MVKHYLEMTGLVLLEMGIGLGKTEIYLSQLVMLLPALRKGHCVFIGVSNHRLSAELKQRAADHGIEAEVYLGPAQPDPDQPGKRMCHVDMLFLVFQAAGIAGELCRACEHSSVCGFLNQ